MARRGMRGQLNMFDFVRSLNMEPSGEVEMVALVPDYEDQEIDETWELELMVTEEPAVEAEEPVVEAEEPAVEAEEPVVVEENPVEVEKPVKKEKQPKAEASTTTEEVSKTEENTTSFNTSRVAMSRRYHSDGKEVEVAYINYNIVRITKEGEEPIIRKFETTKEAVDFYIEQIQEEEINEQ